MTPFWLVWGATSYMQASRSKQAQIEAREQMKEVEAALNAARAEAIQASKNAARESELSRDAHD
jgi:hypothetical protein